MSIISTAITSAALHPMVFDGVTDWLKEFRSPIKTVANTVIILAALFVVATLIVKAVMSSKKQDHKAMVKAIGFAIIACLIAGASVGGVIHLVDHLGVDDGTGITFDNSGDLSGD